MTTIIDPNGTPEIFYRDPAVAVYQVTSSGSNGSNATVIDLKTAMGIVIANDSNAGGIRFTNAKVGDQVILRVEDAHGTNGGVNIYNEDESFLTSSALHLLVMLPSGWIGFN